MKEYCVDLEIAKELKENGFPQKINRFYWIHAWTESLVGKEEHYSIGYNLKSDRYEIERFFAPTSDEILKELPSNFIYDGNHYWLTIIKDNINNYQVYYEKTLEDGFKRKMLFRIIDKKMSNCLALTWLHLKKLEI